MILYINTVKNNSTEIEAGLKDEKGKWIVKKKAKARFKQAEKLLPLIEKLLASQNAGGRNIFKKKNSASEEMKGGKKIDGALKLSVIKQIEVVNQGGSFTSLRIGVVTANALGWALGVKVTGVRETVKAKKADAKTGRNLGSRVKSLKFASVVPEYEKEPNITIKKINREND